MINSERIGRKIKEKNEKIHLNNHEPQILLKIGKEEEQNKNW